MNQNLNKRRQTPENSAPLSWKMFTLFFFALPFLHYIIQAFNLGLSLAEFQEIFSRIHPVMYLIVFMPFIIGYAMYSYKRWAWIVLTEYTGILFGYHFYLAYMENKWQSVLEQGLLLSVFVSILFYNRKDIKIAYQKDFMSIPRGWRQAVRFKISLPVIIQDKTYYTTDISYSGFAVPATGLPLQPGQPINAKIVFSTASLPISSTLLARKTEVTAGFTYRDLSLFEKLSLRKLIWLEKNIQYKNTKDNNFQP